MKNLFIIPLVLLIYTCIYKTSEKKSPLCSDLGKLFVINFEELVGKKQTIGLSQVSSKVEYVKLETTNDCTIGRGPSYLFTDSLIFVSNSDHILKFSRSGKFLGRIGKSGIGPEEIDHIWTISIIPDKKVIVVQKNAPRKLMYFSFDGKFIKAVSIPRYDNLKVLNDDKYIAYISGSVGVDKYNFLLTNEHRDTLSFVKNNDRWRDFATSSFMTDYPYFEPFFVYNNRWYLKSVYNDTVYYISGDRILPGYFINLGKYKLPLEYRPEKMKFTSDEKYFDKISGHYYCNVLESADKIFLTAIDFKSEAKKCFLIERNGLNSGRLLMNKDGKSTGFVNDWDGGLDFWPIGNVNDRQVFMPINITDMKKTLDEKNSDHLTEKISKTQTQLKEMVSHLDILDNPILMIVTLKITK
jgi:hypothetical protein